MSEGVGNSIGCLKEGRVRGRMLCAIGAQVKTKMACVSERIGTSSEND